MQMSIHCLTLIRILVTETHIRYFFPFSGKCFIIPVSSFIKTIQFNIMKKADSILQSFVVCRCPMIFTQSINSKSDSIDLLLSIQRLSMSIYAPINPPKLFIIKAVDYFTFGTSGNFQIFGLMQQAVSSRERPQDACIHDSSLLRFSNQTFLPCDATVKSSIPSILHFFYPVRENISGKHLLHFLFQAFNSSFHHPKCLMLVSLLFQFSDDFFHSSFG